LEFSVLAAPLEARRKGRGFSWPEHLHWRRLGSSNAQKAHSGNLTKSSLNIAKLIP
jgi:hypothetical protein